MKIRCIHCETPTNKHWRCTRDTPYMGDCPGGNNKRARQGYYFNACNEICAIKEMRKRYPNDLQGFTADLWRL